MRLFQKNKLINVVSKFSSPKELLVFREEHERVLSFFVYFILFETVSVYLAVLELGMHRDPPVSAS